MKTRPWKFAVWPSMQHDYHCCCNAVIGWSFRVCLGAEQLEQWYAYRRYSVGHLWQGMVSFTWGSFFIVDAKRQIWLTMKLRHSWDYFYWVKLGSTCKMTWLQGPVSQKSCKLFGPVKPLSKISNLTITELLNSHVLNMNRDSLHTRSFRRIHFSNFRYRWTENGFMGPKSFQAFQERAPGRE